MLLLVFFFLEFALKNKILNVTVSMLVPELKNVDTIKSVRLGCLFIVFLGISQHLGFIVQPMLNPHLTFTLLSV